MDFLLDANRPRSALRTLTDAGHQARHVRDKCQIPFTRNKLDETKGLH